MQPLSLMPEPFAMCRSWIVSRHLGALRSRGCRGAAILRAVANYLIHTERLPAVVRSPTTSPQFRLFRIVEYGKHDRLRGAARRFSKYFLTIYIS